MQVHVTVDEKDMAKLERLHYLVEAKVNLLVKLYESGATQTKAAMADYIDTFKEYSLMKDQVDANYRPAAYYDRCKSWNADFAKGELIYEVED